MVIDVGSSGSISLVKAMKVATRINSFSISNVNLRRLHKTKVGDAGERAISEVSAALPKIITTTDVEQHPWIPIPPSKYFDHPDHDNRLERILRNAYQPLNADVRLILRQTASTEADHAAGARLSPKALNAVLDVDPVTLAAAPIRPRGIVLFDDVLVTGKHFKCCQRLLHATLPGVPVNGVFIARRILPDSTEDFSPL
jgi:hypothetical protein